MTENVDGDTFYVDFERIRKVDEYVYYWYLIDKAKPNLWGDLSYRGYYEGDCKLFRFKILRHSYYTEPMGEGIPSKSNNNPENEWRYPPPDSTSETILKTVCDYVN